MSDEPSLSSLLDTTAGREAMGRLVEVASNYSKRQSQADKVALENVKCACDKVKHISAFKLYNTGYIQAVDNVCMECRGQYAQYARIVCKNCKVPVLWVEPHKDTNGFEFIRGKTYHVTTCPNCSATPITREKPGVAIPVEKISFDYQKSGSKLPLREFMKICLKQN